MTPWLLLLLCFLAPPLGSQVPSDQQPHAPASSGEPAAAPAPVLSPEQIVERNNLSGAGKPPFHLHMTVQLYNLQGRPSEQGVVDFWWAGPDGTHLEITLPGLGTLNTTSTDAVPQRAKRDVFLIGQLLQRMEAPGRDLGARLSDLEREDRLIGTTLMTCLSRRAPVNGAKLSEVCAEQDSGTIRLITSGDDTFVRNRTGSFGSSRVALEGTLSFGRVQGITGQITTLEGFHPEKASVVLEKPKTEASGSPEEKRTVRLGSGVVAGNKISGGQPAYPEDARQARLSGTVVLVATISETGAVVDVFPLTGPSASLVQASLDAVSRWKYKPYLLNGNPVRVITTITVHFNLNH